MSHEIPESTPLHERKHVHLTQKEISDIIFNDETNQKIVDIVIEKYWEIFEKNKERNKLNKNILEKKELEGLIEISVASTSNFIMENYRIDPMERLEVRDLILSFVEPLLTNYNNFQEENNK